MVIADDHRLILDGVRRALETDGGFEIVGETQNGKDVLDLVGKTSPDMVLLDVRMPEMDGLECLDQLRAQFPDVKVVMLSASTSAELVETALRRGASAYVVKSVEPADLPSTLRQVASGTVFSSLAATESGQSGSDNTAGLTEREIVILGRTRPRHVERPDREGALGRAPDGEVPPDERVSQARRQEPDGGCTPRLPARARRAPGRRGRIRSSRSGASASLPPAAARQRVAGRQRHRREASRHVTPTAAPTTGTSSVCHSAPFPIHGAR